MEGEAQTLKSFVDDLITEWEETSASSDVETRNLLSQIIVPILNIGFVIRIMVPCTVKLFGSNHVMIFSFDDLTSFAKLRLVVTKSMSSQKNEWSQLKIFGTYSSLKK